MRKAARVRKQQPRLGQRVVKFSFMVTASKITAIWPADSVDKRPDGLNSKFLLWKYLGHLSTLYQ